MEKVSRLVLIGRLVIISLGLLACQGPTLRPASMPTVEPTSTHNLSVLPNSSTLAPTTTPLAPYVIPSQACLLGSLPTLKEKWWRLNLFAWSPDSNSLTYIEQSKTNNSLVGTLMLATIPHLTLQSLSTADAAGDPTWSPDGSQIAFVAFRSDDQLGTILTVNTNNFIQRDLFPGELARTDSGTGFKAVIDWLDEFRILIMTNCGSGCSRPLRVDLRTGALRPIFLSGQEGAGYSWSPDQTHIGIAAGENYQIGVAATIDKKVMWLSGHKTINPSFRHFWTFFEDWAFDNSHFLFLRQSNEASEVPELWVWDLAAQQGSQLLSGVIAATWSPRDDTIAFISLGQPQFGSGGSRPGGTATPDGPNLLGLGLYQWQEGKVYAYLTVSEVNFGYRWPDQWRLQLLRPVWSPTGEQLVYRDGMGDAWVLSVNDLTRYKLDTKESPTGELRWSPDGKKLAVSVSGQILIFDVPCSPSS